MAGMGASCSRPWGGCLPPTNVRRETPLKANYGEAPPEEVAEAVLRYHGPGKSARRVRRTDEGPASVKKR